MIVFLTAENLGIGGDPTSFGRNQIAGTAIGLIIFLVGVWVKRYINNGFMERVL